MNQISSALVLVLVLLTALAFTGPGGQAHAASSGPIPQEAAPGNQRWEYEVVGLTEIYGSTLDYLKGALDGDKKDFLKLAKRTDEQLVAKTRDLLNEYGEKGWELAEYRDNVLVFKRPVR